MKKRFLQFFCILASFAFSYEEKIPDTNVSFNTSNTTLKKLFDEAERKSLWNIQQFGDYKVLVEGAGYQNVWLETQPMGGYMYGKRNLTIAKNNQLIFLDHQREDGRLPGMLSYENNKIVPHYGWFQGYCLPMPAFELYYWLDKDRSYLNILYAALSRFDDYLWKTRDSDNNGCLETWCVWDTGEDNCIRLEGSPDSWPYNSPPTQDFINTLSADEQRKVFQQQKYNPEHSFPVPMESMDIMSYSYSGREVLALIANELKNGEADLWRKKAQEVRNSIKEYLWDDRRNACFDRDKDNKVMDILIHNNLRCMYYNSFDQAMADAFIREHLLNKNEFWTTMPLPSIAANDSAFRNIEGNNWSGQPQGLTYQRAIRALENYGHYAEVTLLGEKLLQATGSALIFTQQFDPFTGKPNLSKDGYGPVILSVLEYISRMYGIHLSKDEIYWSNIARDKHSYDYEQVWGDNKYQQVCKDGMCSAFINGKEIFSASQGVRIVTDIEGNIKTIIGIDYKEKSARITAQGKSYKHVIEPNAQYSFSDKGKLKEVKRIPFDYKY